MAEKMLSELLPKTGRVPHTHGDVERFAEQPHVHAPNADWSMKIATPMVIDFTEDVDPIDLMEFRYLVMVTLEQVRAELQAADLAEMTPAEAQFTVLAANVDILAAETMLQLVDRVLPDRGIIPCHLQPVESSNIRSLGFVTEQSVDDVIEGLEMDDLLGTLYVAFTNGSLYGYSEVPAGVASEILRDESHGAAFNRLVRSTYEFTKIWDRG